MTDLVDPVEEAQKGIMAFMIEGSKRYEVPLGDFINLMLNHAIIAKAINGISKEELQLQINKFIDITYKSMALAKEREGAP
jgi:hypothetical protein